MPLKIRTQEEQEFWKAVFVAAVSRTNSENALLAADGALEFFRERAAVPQQQEARDWLMSLSQDDWRQRARDTRTPTAHEDWEGKVQKASDPELKEYFAQRAAERNPLKKSD